RRTPRASPLSLHDALPIWRRGCRAARGDSASPLDLLPSLARPAGRSLGRLSPLPGDAERSGRLWSVTRPRGPGPRAGGYLGRYTSRATIRASTTGEAVSSPHGRVLFVSPPALGLFACDS